MLTFALAFPKCAFFSDAIYRRYYKVKNCFKGHIWKFFNNYYHPVA